MSILMHIANNHETFSPKLQNTRKRSGLRNGGLPDILDGFVFLKKAWEKIEPDKISRCWKRAEIASVSTNAHILNQTEFKKKFQGR